MNENQVLARIQSLARQDNRALLAGFWLQMDARPTALPFTFANLRHLDADSRSVFYALQSCYARQQFAPLSARLRGLLSRLITQPRYRDAMPLPACQRGFYLHAGLSATRGRRLNAAEGVQT